MAPISKLIPFLFLTTLFFSLHVNARDSKFFSKVTPLNNNLKETEVTNNEASQNKPQQQQQPVFLPETENSYGLYGHETGLHPPTTTTTDAVPTTFKPYKTTTTQEDNANNFHKKDQDEFSQTRLTGTSFNNYFYSGKDAFEKQNELSDTKFTQGGYSSKENHNNNYFYTNNNENELSDSKYTEGEYNSKGNQNNNYYYNTKNDFGKQNEFDTQGGYKSMEYQNHNAANERYYNNNNKDNGNNRYYKTKAVNNNYNGERQGLSDTRFIEGGKYFYDVNSENYNNPTQYGGSSRGVNSENWSNNRGYFGNNNANSMEGYQNQEQFEDEQEDFEPWASIISVTVKSSFCFWFGAFTVVFYYALHYKLQKC